LGVAPAPKRVKGQGGVVEKPFDLSFIQTGKTLRTEVAEKLKNFDVGLNTQIFFMARWSSSSWVALLGEGGGLSPTPRLWGNQNLLVEFDNTGRVKGYAAFPDHELVSRLAPVAASLPQLDLSHPVEINARVEEPTRAAGKIFLTAGRFDFDENGTAWKHSFDVPVSEITRVDSSRLSSDDPTRVLLVMHFRNKIPALYGGRWARFSVSAHDLATILKFVQHGKQASLHNNVFCIA